VTESKLPFGRFFGVARGRAVRSALAASRVAALALVLAVVSLLVSARSAAARMGDVLRTFAEKTMLDVPGARYASGPRVLSINGVRVHVVTASVDADVGVALDHFESMCAARGGVEGADRILANAAVRTAVLRRRKSILDGVFRSETAGGGTVACLDTGGALAASDLARRLERFAKTGDLAAIGELRYALARRTARGASLLLLWTEGPAPLVSMFPPAGDAPGADPPGLPRPPETRRLLSASELGMPYGTFLYASRVPVAKLEAFYATELPKLGFRVETGERSGVRPALTVRSPDRTLLIRFSPRGGESVVAVEVLA